MKLKHVLLHINSGKNTPLDFVETITTMVEKEKGKCTVYESGNRKLPEADKASRRKHLEADKPDLAIVLGGDGTMLQAAEFLRGMSIPLLGINFGFLGFITALEAGVLKKHLHRVLNGEFLVSERNTLDITIHRNRGRTVRGWALNEALLTRADNPHLITATATVGEQLLTDYRADGILVATPTGSTAYSLAAGGPIISPKCNVITITPICPHALSNRSVVAEADEIIEIVLQNRSGDAQVQADGRTLGKVNHGDRVVIKKSQDPALLAFMPEINFYNIVRSKLGWNGDGKWTR
jgi:NAD+ kinase